MQRGEEAILARCIHASRHCKDESKSDVRGVKMQFESAAHAKSVAWMTRNRACAKKNARQSLFNEEKLLTQACYMKNIGAVNLAYLEVHMAAKKKTAKKAAAKKPAKKKAAKKK